MKNRLSEEKSPYLLQHAENPVNWYAWSDKAFDRARAENKPVFLSIGYSTCHWCHVMAHESFEDEEIARILNESYVAVKVDREERPEVDIVYMSVCQTMTGSGGWPLTIIMTPEKKPFFAGTYLPKDSRYGMMGLTELLQRVASLWKDEQERVLQESDNILYLLKSRKRVTEKREPSLELVEKGFQELQRIFDPKYGGFGGAPKFPTPQNIWFLLWYYERKGEEQALVMADKTLVSMARGGIYDQIGGGFSRYSTDEKWLVPHFEKMLYDNALLTMVYLEGYRITGEMYYKRVAEGILKYVSSELSDKEGGCYCGQDADSEGTEGKYYVFTREEIDKIFERTEEAEAFCQWFGIKETGNFEGKNILNLIQNTRYGENNSGIERLCKKAYQYRLNRTALHRDDKILTVWNAMMAMAYAEAGFLLEKKEYITRAEQIVEFIENKLTDQEDRLLIRYRDGESAHLGNLDDYAYYGLCLLTLYQVTWDIRYLKMAVNRAEQMVELFWDSENGGFYFYGNDVQELIERPKEVYDGAMPSGNSVAVGVLLALDRLTADRKWQSILGQQMEFLAGEIEDHPSAHCFSLVWILALFSSQKELVCTSKESRIPEELPALIRRLGVYRMTVIFKCPKNEKELSETVPFTKEYRIPQEGTLYYLCENHACAAPTADIANITFSLSGK